MLAALVLDRGAPVGVHRLTQSLWPDPPVPASAAKAIHGCINRLRGELGQETIETTPTGYRLGVEAVTIDATFAP